MVATEVEDDAEVNEQPESETSESESDSESESASLAVEESRVGMRVGFSAAPLRVRADANVARKRAPKGVPTGMNAGVRGLGACKDAASQRILGGMVPS